MSERKIGLVATVSIAVVVLVGVSIALLIFDSRTTGADALRTGGLAAGSVVALYALWLNDRRRRVEEQRQEVERARHELETRRADLDRDRVADERFARAVELLGHEADQVRVGALHALAGLARSNPGYIQTVLDVLCSYLRRPFLHPRYGNAEDNDWSQREAHLAERKLVIRLTAQRLIADLLPRADDQDAPQYDLDLTGALLEYFDLSDRKVGTLILRYGQLFSSNNFSRSEFHGPVWFTGTSLGSGRISGRFYCDDAVFHDRAWFSGVKFHGRVSVERTRFKGPVKFSDSRFTDRTSPAWAGSVFEGPADFRTVHFEHDVDLSGATFHGEVQNTGITTNADREATLPDGWKAGRA
ncbi:pentapeptide repeat-containing protein [Saccharopolyspora spinosa]|uniref:Pentapeptide repeat protein n=1 Tax=Saccharopolyspora spinosa TaxID=60894 RepID=A0A2N3XRJ0_SACSN|nr:pentapeptide repeat-containing protein [Saccharopolyspora spinosa]PKW13220.1 pentapeptide repeat protein [Saccharopolyspora spinosa]